MTTKAELHELIDQLPEGGLEVLAAFLADPELPGLLRTPEGEEPLSLEEIVGILEGKRDAREGRVAAFADWREGIRWLREQATRKP